MTYAPQTLLILTLTFSLFSCDNTQNYTSCTGVDTRPKSLEINGVSSQFYSSTSQNISDFERTPQSGSDRKTPLTQNDVHNASTIAIGIFSEVEVKVLSSLFKLRFSLLNSAYACKPAPPSIETPIQSIKIFINYTDIENLNQGDEVTDYFNVLVSDKNTQTTPALALWNELDHINKPLEAYGDTRLSALLVFSHPDEIELGTYGFSIQATLQDGSVWTYDTDYITITDEEPVNIIEEPKN